MNRRDLLKSAAAIAASGALAGTGSCLRPSFAQDAGSDPVPGPRPNILFILVDELRFPSVFPAGVTGPEDFLARFMPNVHSLWARGVKFGRHYTAANACTPARGVLITGLYSQQNWLLVSLYPIHLPGQIPAPTLNPAYPTYGKLLRRAGYQTPYIGKWHVSNDSLHLDPYGFDGFTSPDPTGFNLQGTVGDTANGFLNDQDISAQAAQWLSARQPDDQPWCLTVSFVNPHDQQFFWAGTEFQTYNSLFPAGSLQPLAKYSTPQNPPVVPWDADLLKIPPSFGYDSVPPNWETAAALQANKPSIQVSGRLFQAAVWGAVTDDPNQSDFTVQRYSAQTGNLGIGLAPYSYWQRGLDCYTYLMTIVDQRVGEVLDALPSEVAQNTIIVFTSDHGEYAGAHGFVAGRIMTCYDEAFHVPLIVADPSGRFVDDIDTVRTELTSSVDMLTFLVSLAHKGKRNWITGDLAQIYGNRHDMIPILRSASMPGRDYVLLATDEPFTGPVNFNNAPWHVLGLRTQSAKLGTYSNWAPLSSAIEPGTELEF
ncbi:MAG: sulfatase-like hydrolase/transferase, partial [Acetobacteraceae bacterium]|nr:sulfatase-like hydrolase/transferase [Acetobacteraceae bacterium]